MTLKRKAKTDYNEKFTQDLLDGVRRGGMTINEVCQAWDIVRKTYYSWKELHPEFNEACEIGERDYAAFWDKLGKDGAQGLVKVDARLYLGIRGQNEGWAQKRINENRNETQIAAININVLPTREQAKVIEQQPNDNVVHLIKADEKSTN